MNGRISDKHSAPGSTDMRWCRATREVSWRRVHALAGSARASIAADCRLGLTILAWKKDCLRHPVLPVRGVRRMRRRQDRIDTATEQRT